MCKDCTEDEKKSLADGRCPDCQGTRFLEGPHGGMGVKIKCANAFCGAQFNIVPGLASFAERIGLPAEPKELQA